MTQPIICDSNKKRPSVPEFCDFGEWEVSVNSLMDIKEPNRDHAYVLPDDSVWVLNHEGTVFLQLNLSLNSKGDPGPKGEKGEKGETGQQGENAYFYTAWSNSIDGFDDFTTTLEPPRPNMLENTDFKTVWQRSSLVESEIKYEGNVVRVEKKESQKNRSILYLPITTSFLELGVCYATAIEVYLESGDLGANTNIFFRNTAPNQSDVALTKIPNTIPKNQWVRLVGFSEECNHLPNNLAGCFFGIGISADFVGVVKFRKPKMEKDIPINNQTSQYILHVNDDDYQPFEAKFAYMGTLATTEKIPSKDYKDYQWSKIVGDTGAQGLKGDKGDVGAQGPKGDTGDTGVQGLKGDNAYLHMAWSQSSDGFDGFTTTLESPRPNMLENTDFKKAWQRSNLVASEVTYSNGNEVRIEKTEPNANGYRSALYLPITTKFLEIGERYAISIEVYLESGDLGSNTNTYFRNNATKHFDVAIAKIPNDIPKNQWVRITGSSEECKDLPTDLSNCYFGIGITKDFVGAVRFRRPKMEKNVPYGEIGTPYILNENDENYQPFEPNYTYLGTLTNAEKIPSKNHTDYQWLKITGKQVDDGYTDYTNEISFNETQYFSIVEKQMTKQEKTVYLSVNLEGIKAFNLVRNQQIKIGKLTHADVFPTTRVAINFVTISADMAIYANTAMIIEKNGDIVLINTSDVTIGSAFNFKVGNQHLLHLSYVVL